MEPERRKQIVLAGLGIVLVVVAVRAWTLQSSVPLPSSNGAAGQTPAARRPKGATAATGAPDVHLKALGVERSKPTGVLRNLFRFKPNPPPAPPPPAPRIVAPPPAAREAPTAPPPPPVPPIALKFIGLVQTADKTQRLAVLSDGRGGIPIYGKEGDIIEGRYRILRIGTESIELTYLDGRGRQTIRLSGG
jgi:hypothetical protein